MSAGEWCELLRGDKYEHTVATLRKAVALFGDRHEGELAGVRALPDVCLCAGDDYRGVMVLTLPVADGVSWQQLRKGVALLPQTLLGQTRS